MTHHHNAKVLLKQIVKKRAWHQITGDKPGQKAAGRDKELVLAGKLSYEKCCQWLLKLGYKKVSEETWIR